MKDKGCESCPLDPCRLYDDECALLWELIEFFEQMSNIRYAQSSSGSAKNDN